MLERFRSSQEGTLFEQFLALRQESSDMEDMPKHVMEGTFVNGLKSDIRAEVRM